MELVRRGRAGLTAAAAATMAGGVAARMGLTGVAAGTGELAAAVAADVAAAAAAAAAGMAAMDVLSLSRSLCLGGDRGGAISFFGLPSRPAVGRFFVGVDITSTRIEGKFEWREFRRDGIERIAGI
jgi:hypothetical protein